MLLVETRPGCANGAAVSRRWKRNACYEISFEPRARASAPDVRASVRFFLRLRNAARDHFALHG